jgi:hypothetical protein
LNPNNGENHLLSEKGLNLVTQAISPPGTTGVLEGRAPKGGARAREFRNSQGDPNPLWARCLCTGATVDGAAVDDAAITKRAYRPHLQRSVYVLAHG